MVSGDHFLRMETTKVGQNFSLFVFSDFYQQSNG